MQTIGKYLRELSVVVVGIAITFGINNWINYKNSEKDLEQYLNTVKLEIKTNIEEFDNEINSIYESTNYTRYLLSHNKEALNPDTIQSYRFSIFQISLFKYRHNAFEMFKSTGSMRLINDKQVLLSIWDAYDIMDEIPISQADVKYIWPS